MNPSHTPLAVLVPLLLAGCGGDGGLPPSVPPAPTNMTGFDPELSRLIVEGLEAVRSSAGEPRVWAELGMLYEAHLMSELAQPAYEEAVRLAESDPKLWYRVALTRMKNGDLPAALEALGHVSRLEPGYFPAWCQRAEWLLELGQLEAAREAFERARELEPTSAVPLLGQAQVALATGDPGGALASLAGPALLEGANAPLAHRLRGKALFRLGREKQAQREIELGRGARLALADPWSREVAAFKRGTAALLLRADRLGARGSHAKALEILQELALRVPDDARVMRKLGLTHARLSRWSEARQALAAAVALEPDDAPLRVSLAGTCFMEGEPLAALAELDRAVDLDPGVEGGHGLRLEVLLDLGRFEQVLGAHEQAVRAGLRGADLDYSAGRAQFELGHHLRALELFRGVLEQQPERAEAWLGRGHSEAQLGQRSEAGRSLEQARTAGASAPALAELEAAIGAQDQDKGEADGG